MLDENTVKITGFSKLSGGGMVQIITCDDTAPIFQAAPKWATENDFFVSASDDEYGMSTIYSFDHDSLFESFNGMDEFYYAMLHPHEGSLSAKAGENSYEVTMSYKIRDGLTRIYEDTYLIERKTEDEYEISLTFFSKTETEDGPIDEGEYLDKSPATKASLVTPVPEWAKDIFALVDEEETYQFPVSTNALSSYYDGYEIFSFDRTVGGDSLEFSIEYKVYSDDGDYSDSRWKEVYKVEKTETEGVYKCSRSSYSFDDEKAEYTFEHKDSVDNCEPSDDKSFSG